MIEDGFPILKILYSCHSFKNIFKNSRKFFYCFNHSTIFIFTRSTLFNYISDEIF